MAECPCIVLFSEALPLLRGWGGTVCPCIVLFSDELPLLGWEGGAECPCIVLVSEALPLPDGGRISMYCTSQ